MYLRLILTLLLIVFPFFVALSADREVTVRYDMRDGLAGSLVGGGVQDRDGLMWFATWNGLNCYDGYEFHWLRISPGDSASIGTNRIRDILMSDEGNIVCRTDDGIYEFDLISYSFRDIEPDRIVSLKGRMGRRWHGTVDSQGCRWSADRNGLYKSYRRDFPARMLEGSEGSHPRSFLVDSDGQLWVGSRSDHKIRVYTPAGVLVREVSLDTAPYCLFQSSDGDIWVGGKPGALMRMGEKSISDDAVYDIREDRYGRLWVATFGEGVKCCANPRASSPVLSESLGGGKVRKLIITPSGNLVAATTEGLMIGDINDRDYRHISLRPVVRDGDDPGSLCSNATMGLAQDASGNIYIATESSGLDMISEESLFSGTPSFRHFSMANSSLPSDMCNAVTLASDSVVMIVGNSEVMMLNPVTDRVMTLGRAFWNDTCDFAETTPVRLADGSWLLGAEQGAFIADTSSISGRGYEPPLVFTTLSVNGGAEEFCLVPRHGIELEADMRNVTVGFAAIDYVDNEDIMYRTRLDGSPWTGGRSRRVVTLFNLEAGEHVLEVQSTDRYGRWADNGRSLVIVVKPHMYETWWARALAVILLSCVLSGAVWLWLYIRDVNRQRRELFEKYMGLINERHDGGVADDGTGIDDAVRMIVPEQKPEDAAFLERVSRYIEDNMDNPDAAIDDMAVAAAVSRSTLNRRLRSLMGVTAAQLLIESRMQRAQQLLDNGGAEAAMPLAEVALKCGYADPYYFQRVFRKRFGVSPSEYRGSDGCTAQI